ncbi:GntR family transcriptional regulator [Mycobacterium sp. KBS0706]|uniref:GntR family transcriptional regulator n=1 Tax=Mycobacterium sp. KBS0706 TaxID=2578109 RepID=UPI00110F7F84|nr:GntR family transcriptional regulator [Mycobacterium sp. KBS0706]TSD83652.1 GntR family transcriptional regulator [Mycobacterium sp. KBS0706]
MAGGDDAARRDTCYARLKQMAVHCRFRPGEHLKIGRLCERLRASSTPVREALIRLHAEGLVTASAREGFFARIPDAHEFSELYRLGRALLLHAVETSLPGGAPPDPTATAAPLADPPPQTAAWAAIEGLTLDLARLSGNREVARVIANVNDRIRCVRIIACLDADLVRGMVADARRLAHAVAAADTAVAAQTLETMLDRDIRRLPDLTKELLARAHAGGLG